MFDCHQDEQIFWRTMNPARLHALFDARFRPNKRTALSPSRQDEEMSLSSYLMGGV
ncbi:MAG: hypothetical protein J6S60_06185 [Oscillospiraceae bacterium]|nr:hypothetical protein [Oscillospiraceae bacterium]